MIVIIGGGIAGLWTLAALRTQGRPAILLERQGLGAGQTLASQGIIHGGTKYALTGQLSGAAQVIAQMPARWLAALRGEDAVDLRSAKLFSAHQYLWTTRQLSARLTAFFASKVMRSRMQHLDRAALPAFFPDRFSGTCYRLEEPVFDVPSVLRCFVAQCAQSIFTDVTWQLDGDMLHVRTPELVFDCRPHTMIYAAGAANAGLSTEKQQLRPLHMTALRVPHDAPAIYGHCLGHSDKPKITVTTHPYDYTAPQGDRVYWIGGQVAEHGALLTAPQQIAAVQTVLDETLPWLPRDWCTDERRYLAVRVDRAEGLADGKRPDQSVIVKRGSAVTVWPTKLAFAPLVADRILAKLPDTTDSQPLDFPEHTVRISSYPWQS